MLLVQIALADSVKPKEGYEYQVSKLSNNYFHNFLNGKLDLAYETLAENLRGQLSLEKYRDNKKQFIALAGETLSIEITKLTLYENPENAPVPGIYLVADYYNAYSQIPVHCGYLVWIKGENSNRFKLVREESGYITDEQFQKMSKNQLDAIKRQLKCVDPR